ncbi:MAG: DUF6345 domain-containing protein [Ignisphaera sp.]
MEEEVGARQPLRQYATTIPLFVIYYRTVLETNSQLLFERYIYIPPLNSSMLGGVEMGKVHKPFIVLFITAVLSLAIALPAPLITVRAANPSVTDSDNGVWSVGAMYINAYSSCQCSANDLQCCDDAASYILTLPGFRQGFLLADGAVTDLALIDKTYGGADDVYADSVDLLLFAGHGDVDNLYVCNSRFGCCVTPSMMRLGDKDLEWFIVDSCKALKSMYDDLINSPWIKAFKGLHAVAGFATTVPDVDATYVCIFSWCFRTGYACGLREKYFVNYFSSGETFATAWLKATKEALSYVGFEEPIISCVFGPWDDKTQSYGIYDAPYKGYLTNDVYSPVYFMGMCTTIG